MSLPAECEVRGPLVDDVSCSFDFACPSQSLDAIHCGVLDSERWKCTCGIGIDGGTFELTGAAGVDVCMVGAGLCNHDDLDLGDETCVDLYDDGTLDSCSLTLSCGRPIAAGFPPGVAAWLTRYPSGNCQRDEAGLPFACSCLVGDDITNYGLVADSGTAACHPLVDFCRSGEKPVFDGDTTCVDAFPTSTEDSCSLLQDCVTPMKLTDDVSLALVEGRNATCAQNETGGSVCTCTRPSPGSQDHERFQFEIEEDSDTAACAAATLNCDWGAVIQPLGNVSCEPDIQGYGADSCSSYLLCRQPASVDGRDVVAVSELVIRCERFSPASDWACGCASGPDTAIFDLGAPELEPAAACEAAPARCMEHIAVYLGPSVDPMGAPDPLPARVYPLPPR